MMKTVIFLCLHSNTQQRAEDDGGAAWQCLRPQIGSWVGRAHILISSHSLEWVGECQRKAVPAARTPRRQTHRNSPGEVRRQKDNVQIQWEISHRKTETLMTKWPRPFWCSPVASWKSTSQEAFLIGRGFCYFQKITGDFAQPFYNPFQGKDAKCFHHLFILKCSQDLSPNNMALAL